MGESSLRELHKLHLRQEWAIAEDSFETPGARRKPPGAAHLARFFDPAHYRRAWNELPFLTANGDFLRIDRLVEFEHEVWVLDYKSTEAASDARSHKPRSRITRNCKIICMRCSRFFQANK